MVTPTFYLTKWMESNKPTQQTINFWFGENVVYTIFEANAWMLINSQLCSYFKKRRIKSSCYVIICCLFWTLLQLSLHSCQFTCTTFHHISKKKKAHSSFFSKLKRSYLWKMCGYPQFSFWNSIAPDMIYLSHIVIIWEKILPICGHRP